MVSKRERPNRELSVKKRIIFTVLMLAIPVLLIILVEVGLNLANYGGDLELFIEQTSGSGSEYVLNSNITKRYFFRKGIKTPAPLSQTFSVKKDSLTYRIFCLGASTTQGFPYPPSAAFPATLKNVLSTVHPERNFEVINCGITAITSHSVLDMSREILNRYKPDLLILYTGHNEFYGALGQASRMSLFKNRTMIRTFLKLQNSRLLLLLRNTIITLFGERVTRESVIDHATLMGTVAREASITYKNALFQRTEEHFKDNLTEIIKETDKHETDIVLCTLVSNLDFEPFASMHSASFTQLDTAKWVEIIGRAEKMQADGEFQKAANRYLAALEMDSCHSQTHYRLAKCYQALKMENLAAKYFQLARDYDPVRFRAPSSFNTIIREIAAKYDVPVVDVENEFNKVSPLGIVGRNLILEHVHPNQRGYLMVGQAIARTMSDQGMIKDIWDWQNNKTDSAYLEMSHLTLLDHEMVNYSIFRLTSHWPFNVDVDETRYARIGTEQTERLAKALVDSEEGSLVKSHLDLGLEYYQRGDLDSALDEYLAALAIEPVCETYSRIGLLYTRKTEMASRVSKNYQDASQNFRKALDFFKEGLERCPEQIGLNFNLGLLYALRNDRTDEAQVCFEKVLESEPEHRNALYQLGQIYIRRSEFEKAKSFLLDALVLYPEDSEFYRNLGLVYARLDNVSEAKRYLDKALVLNPDDTFAKHYLNQINAQVNQANKSSQVITVLTNQMCERR
jgi:tetratricopeptide (TPR) repeat protein